MIGTYKLHMTIFCGSAADAEKTARFFNGRFGIDATPFVAQVKVEQNGDFHAVMSTINAATDYGELEFLVKHNGL